MPNTQGCESRSDPREKLVPDPTFYISLLIFFININYIFEIFKMLLLLIREILNRNFDFRGGFDLISPVLNPSLLYDPDPDPQPC